MSWIDDFLDAVIGGFSGMDMSTLKPIDCFEIFPLYAKEGVKRILKIIDLSKGYDLKELGNSMFSPSVIRVEMMFELIKARMAGVNEEDRLKIASFYDSLLRSICLRDPYAKEGKNIIHNKNEIRNYLKSVRKANPEIARILGLLANSCYQLSYGLYSDINPQICYDNFGPYDLSEEFGKGHILVIKQFQNLKPVELWGDKVSDLPCDKIVIYSVYEGVGFSVDAASHANFEGDLINGLRYFCVEIDGRLVDDLDEIRAVSEVIGLKAIEMWTSLISLDFESAKKKYLEQRCYNYKGLSDLIGFDWRPTKEMVEAVRGKELVKNYWPEFKNSDEEVTFWRLFMDPRVKEEELNKYVEDKALRKG